MQNSTGNLAIIILSEGGGIADKVLQAARDNGETYVLHPPGGEMKKIAGVKYVACEKSVTKSLNTISLQCEKDYILVTNDNFRLENGISGIISAISPASSFIFGDYYEAGKREHILRESYEGPEDITERAELGPVAIYPVEYLRAVGGWEESLKYAYDYDLRLKLSEWGMLHRIPQSLGELRIVEEQSEESKKLFFPGKGKYGGFSYLFMEPEEEREIERIFTDCLKRRGAYLEGEAPPMAPEPADSPVVSVITPVYNRENFIGQAIESVIGGKFADFEYIIIDNGSEDNTAAVVEKYAAKDSRIRLVRNPINRIGVSLNLGLKHARGKYISQLDSDDLYTPDTLKTMVEFMEDSNCGLGISYYSLIDAEGSDLPEFGVIKHPEYSRNNILRVDGAGAVRMWRKAAMMEFGGFDAESLVDYGEDYDLVLKVGERYKVGRVHEILYKYRRHPDNSDVLRDPMFKLKNKNLARQRALNRRKAMNESKR